MSANGHDVLKLRQEALSASPGRDAADPRKAAVVKYFRQDRSLFPRSPRKERQIRYDFQDPVLNKEFKETDL